MTTQGRPHPQIQISRRSFLKGTATTVGALAVGDLLAACGGSPAPAATRALRVAAAGLGTATTLDPRRATPGASFVILDQIYDPLLQLRGDEYVQRLAREVESSADATRWTVRIREQASFHDGRPVRAADVLHSLRTIADPRLSPSFALSYADVDFAASRVRDPHTVELALRRPRGDFAEAVLAMNSLIFPAGTTRFADAVGSGPFRLQSVRPGRSAVLLANEDYWDGAPSIERLEVLTIASPEARLNGVRNGQVDYAVGISPTGAEVAEGDPAVKVVRGGPANSNSMLIALNSTLPPFRDARAREAVRLAVDRPALVDQALLGQGTVGNDLVGKNLPGYASGLPQRSRDLAAARSLFGAAGAQRLELRSADLVPGLTAASRLVGQQLGEAGVEVEVEAVDAGGYFSDLKSILATPMQAFYFINRPAAVHLATAVGPRSPLNVMGYGAAYERELQVAQATTDAARRRQRFLEIQQQLYERGGEVVWGFQEQLDAARPDVEGVELTQSVPLFARARVG